MVAEINFSRLKAGIIIEKKGFNENILEKTN
jgi:hypothetical protein